MVARCCLCCHGKPKKSNNKEREKLLKRVSLDSSFASSAVGDDVGHHPINYEAECDLRLEQQEEDVIDLTIQKGPPKPPKRLHRQSSRVTFSSDSSTVRDISPVLDGTSNEKEEVAKAMEQAQKAFIVTSPPTATRAPTRDSSKNKTEGPEETVKALTEVEDLVVLKLNHHRALLYKHAVTRTCLGFHFVHQTQKAFLLFLLLTEIPSGMSFFSLGRMNDVNHLSKVLIEASEALRKEVPVHSAGDDFLKFLRSRNCMKSAKETTLF